MPSRLVFGTVKAEVLEIFLIDIFFYISTFFLFSLRHSCCYLHFTRFTTRCSVVCDSPVVCYGFSLSLMHPRPVCPVKVSCILHVSVCQSKQSFSKLHKYYIYKFRDSNSKSFMPWFWSLLCSPLGLSVNILVAAAVLNHIDLSNCRAHRKSQVQCHKNDDALQYGD